ncbi:MAG: DUF4239 domain-containing protein [Anaerolineae bacterium]|jgi:hypothetical protein
MILLDQSPLWVVYVVTVVLALLFAEIGFRLGLWLQRRDPEAGKMPVSGTVVGGMLGLMAFLLAFCIGIVINQHNGRKAMVVTEANAVGTAYLRAGFLDEADRDLTRDLLREYVEIRLAAATDESLLQSTITRSEEIHNELWSIVEERVRQGQESEVMALFIESINEVIDVHSLRLAAVDLRLPELLWLVLYAATMLSFLLVGVSNSADGKRDPLAILLFALAYVSVLMIIVDLDRAQQGILTVSQTALSDLLRQMTAPMP